MSICILLFFDSRSSRAYCYNATKVMCVDNVFFGQERLTEQFPSMCFFYDSVIPLRNGARTQVSTSLSTRSFCESILFAHLKALRGSELRLVRTVAMVRLDEILSEILSKNGTCVETTTTSLLQPIVCTNQCYQTSVI